MIDGYLPSLSISRFGWEGGRSRMGLSLIASAEIDAPL
jgi:hypothetical protein